MYEMFFLCFTDFGPYFRVWSSYKKPTKSLKNIKDRKNPRRFLKNILFSRPGSDKRTNNDSLEYAVMQ